MLNLEREWLASVPWQAVVAKNRELCLKGENTPHEPNPAGYESARKLWEDMARREMKLRAVLDTFKQVHKLAPFTFFNGNTMGAIAGAMMDEVLAGLPSNQAEMARRTVSHYVVGWTVKAGELEQVMSHLGSLRRALPAKPATAPVPAKVSPAPAGG